MARTKRAPRKEKPAPSVTTPRQEGYCLHQGLHQDILVTNLFDWDLLSATLDALDQKEREIIQAGFISHEEALIQSSQAVSTLLYGIGPATRDQDISLCTSPDDMAFQKILKEYKANRTAT